MSRVELEVWKYLLRSRDAGRTGVKREGGRNRKTGRSRGRDIAAAEPIQEGREHGTGRPWTKAEGLESGDKEKIKTSPGR